MEVLSLKSRLPCHRLLELRKRVLPMWRTIICRVRRALVWRVTRRINVKLLTIFNPVRWRLFSNQRQVYLISLWARVSKLNKLNSKKFKLKNYKQNLITLRNIFCNRKSHLKNNSQRRFYLQHNNNLYLSMRQIYIRDRLVAVGIDIEGHSHQHSIQIS